MARPSKKYQARQAAERMLLRREEKNQNPRAEQEASPFELEADDAFSQGGSGTHPYLPQGIN